MDIVSAILRLIHIGSGVFWAGAALMMAGFIEPAASAGGPEGQKFMRQLMQGKLSMYIGLAATLTVLSGAWLYWAHGFYRPEIIFTGPALGFGLGAAVGLIAWGVGMFVTRPASEKLAALGRNLQGPPTPEQLGQMKAMQERLGAASRWSAILSGLSLALMAVARSL